MRTEQKETKREAVQTLLANWWKVEDIAIAFGMTKRELTWFMMTTKKEQTK